MIYQLPSGKVINISLETYLSMSDDDLKYLEEQNFGKSAPRDIFSDNDVDDDDLESDTPTETINIDEIGSEFVYIDKIDTEEE